MTIFCLYIFDRYALPNKKTRYSLIPGTATASTTTTGSTAQSVQNAPTKAATSSPASRTPSCLHSAPRPPRGALRPRPRPSPARAIPSPRPRASSSRSAIPASHHPRVSPLRVSVHRHPRPPLRQVVQHRERACLLMRRPSWCMVSSSPCGIWSSGYLAGAYRFALTSPLPFSPPGFEASPLPRVHAVVIAHFNLYVMSFHRSSRFSRAGTSRLSATARRRTNCTCSKPCRATASSC